MKRARDLSRVEGVAVKWMGWLDLEIVNEKEKRSESRGWQSSEWAGEMLK